MTTVFIYCLSRCLFSLNNSDFLNLQNINHLLFINLLQNRCSLAGAHSSVIKKEYVLLVFTWDKRFCFVGHISQGISNLFFTFTREHIRHISLISFSPPIIFCADFFISSLISWSKDVDVPLLLDRYWETAAVVTPILSAISVSFNPNSIIFFAKSLLMHGRISHTMISHGAFFTIVVWVL